MQKPRSRDERLPKWVCLHMEGAMDYTDFSWDTIGDASNYTPPSYPQHINQVSQYTSVGDSSGFNGDMLSRYLKFFLDL